MKYTSSKARCWAIASLLLILGGSVAGCGTAGEGLFAANSNDDDDDEGAGGDTSSSSTSARASATNASSSASEGASSSVGTAVSATAAASTGAGVPPQIDCGAVSCVLDGVTACCWDRYQQNAPPQAQCVTGGPAVDECATEILTANGGGLETRIECQRAEHCPGQQCCGHRVFFNLQQDAYYDAVDCQSSCDWADDRVVLCDGPDFPCPMLNGQGAPVQGICQASQLLPPGYMVCGMPP